MMRFWILSLLLPLTLAISGMNIDPSRIKVFPDDHKVSGVFQVSYRNPLNQLVYSFNASEARDVCLSLGYNIASKSQVDEAHRQGLETCRFGWIDEHFVVIPRVEASLTCGKNQTGVIIWRASVTKAFDVFCFDESDLKLQLEDTTTDTPLTTPGPHESLHPPPGAATSTSTSLPPAITHLPQSPHSASPTSQSPSSPLSLGISPSTSVHPFPDSSDEGEAELPQTRSSAQSSIGAVPKALLITSTFVLLLTAMAMLWYFKMNKSLFPCWDVEQQKEYIETEEWSHACVKKDMREAQTEAEEEEDISKETANDLSANTSSETDSATEEP